MMQRVLACAALAVTLVLPAGCGKNPTESLDFKAPAGWTSTPSMFGFKVWIKDSKNNGEIVFLMDLAGKADANLARDVTKDIAVKGYPNDVGVVRKKSHIKICGNHDAEYVQAASKKNGQRLETDAVVTNWDKDLYIALYSRPANVGADPAGLAAIRSVCLKK